nr:MAG TPA: hypothetical protein [Crassvirales sp.]
MLWEIIFSRILSSYLYSYLRNKIKLKSNN